MNKKIVGLILVIFLFGCIEQQIQEPKEKEYEIKINSSEFNFKTDTIKLEVYSGGKLKKTRFEVFNIKQKLICFDYFDLKKGINEFSIKCSYSARKNITQATAYKSKLLLEVTPSDGAAKKFEIRIKPKESIELKKGLKYVFESRTGLNEITDLNVFILDENKDFFKGIVYSKIASKDAFSLFLIDRNSWKIYSSGLKRNCIKAFESKLRKGIYFEDEPEGEEELWLLLPFYFFYIQKEKEFNSKEFFAQKYFAFEKSNKDKVEFILGEKLILNGYKVYETTHVYNKETSARYYVQAENPHVLMYYERESFVFKFKEEIKEEFDKEKNGCFSG